MLLMVCIWLRSNEKKANATFSVVRRFLLLISSLQQQRLVARRLLKFLFLMVWQTLLLRLQNCSTRWRRKLHFSQGIQSVSLYLTAISRLKKQKKNWIIIRCRLNSLFRIWLIGLKCTRNNTIGLCKCILAELLFFVL